MPSLANTFAEYIVGTASGGSDLEHPDFGHAEFQVNPAHQHLLDKPMARWLEGDVPQD
jgi:hypothetical protein